MIESEIIRKARQANLAQYLISIGVQLKPQGNRHRHTEHNSLVFTDNAYKWNSRSESGNALDYLVRHMGFDFPQAVAELTKERAANQDQQTAATKIIFNESNLNLGSDNIKVVQYLNKSRYISHSTIDFLISKSLLFQQKQTNNAIFPIYDENKNLVGAELQGIIPKKRFKGITGGSKYGYGFNVQFSNDNAFDYALFFESAIDLISFIDWKLNHKTKSLDRCILISMSGLKINIIRHTLKAFQGNMKTVLCVDNDEAGQNFKTELQKEKISFSVCTPADGFKDWNEQVSAWRTDKPIQRLIKNGKTLF